MVDLEQSKKRARLELMEQVEIEVVDNDEDSDDDDVLSTISDSESEGSPERPQSRSAPRGFLCPLTMEIMLDPVLDAEGNTYERRALLEWLKQHRSSPISCQPLSERMIIPNNALRDAIHEFMGREWVARKITEQQERTGTDLMPLAASTPTLFSSYGAETVQQQGAASRFRAKIDCFLQSHAHEIGGLKLRLNQQGCCAFRYDNITIVLDVPEQVGVFCLYTRDLVPKLTDRMKDRLLELNFLQGDTRGGCLSVKKHDDGRSEVMFSYTDRVPEVTAQDFCNILLNFVETAVSLRNKLLAEEEEEESGRKSVQGFTGNEVIKKQTAMTAAGNDHGPHHYLSDEDGGSDGSTAQPRSTPGATPHTCRRSTVV